MAKASVNGTKKEWLVELRRLQRAFDRGEAIDDSEKLLEEVPAMIGEILRLNEVLDDVTAGPGEGRW